MAPSDTTSKRWPTALGCPMLYLSWGGRNPWGWRRFIWPRDVILHPARSDPFPVVILDAMSWSRVVIGSDVCGNVEDRIISGVNGFAFPRGRCGRTCQDHAGPGAPPGEAPGPPPGQSSVAFFFFILPGPRKTAEAWPVERGCCDCLGTGCQDIDRQKDQNKCAF